MRRNHKKNLTFIRRIKINEFMRVLLYKISDEIIVQNNLHTFYIYFILNDKNFLNYFSVLIYIKTIR